MVNELPKMNLKAIGIVQNELKQPGERDCKDIISEIVIDSSLTEALESLEEFSHIIVLYWIHQSNRQAPNKIHPMGKQEIPLKGRFATRSPNRPNPVGIATVRLLQHRDNILKVSGLDAIDDSPVIDIKPYIPGHDSVNDAKTPSWITKR